MAGYVARIRSAARSARVGDRRRFGFARRSWLVFSVVAVDAYRVVVHSLESPFIWGARQLPSSWSHAVVVRYGIRRGRL